MASDRVDIISIPKNSAHQRFIAAFKGELLRLRPNMNIIEQSVNEYKLDSNDSLTVTLGSRALSKTASLKGKKLHTLIAHSLYEKIYQTDKKDAYHLTFDQPIKRILNLQSLAFPHSKTVGILLGNKHPKISREFYKEIKRSGRKLIIDRVGDDFSGTLLKLLSKSDSLLLFPDSSVVNRTTINTLVLDSFRMRVPLLGYSKALVKAGAMLSIYSTPEEMGKQSAQIANRIIAGKSVPLHSYPKQFELLVNYKLSRIYDLDIPSESELHAKIVAGELK
ncbi:MAG: hypothetical protein OEL79_03810 [Chromatiales bacterium]|nr:hypothetical protein [Chromatiales bacterium]